MGPLTKYQIKAFTLQQEGRLSVPLFFNTKLEPYYENEDDYGKIPQYKWEDISNVERAVLYKKKPDV